MRSLLVAALSVTALAAACGKNSEPPPPSSGRANAQPETGPSRTASRGPGADGEPSQAEKMFATVCATCHGMDGTGKGPAAESLNPKPRDYTDAKWQASITDDQLRETILKGGQAMGKSPMMPGQPQLADHRDVLDDLVKIIRKFGKRP
jgi:cytochrome c553